MSKHNVRLALAVIVIALLAAACTSGVRVARDLPDEHGRSSGVVPDVGVVQAVGHPAAGDRQPNIVLVLMDDFSKDLLPTMRSVRYMARHGASYDNAYVVDSLCCVSRAATFTGQYPHQTGVFTNSPNLPNARGPMGGWRAFAENGGEGRTFALRLQESGYTTGYVGKYLNGYEAMRGHQVPPVPRGWSDFRAIFGTAYDQWKFHASIPDEHGVNELVEVPAPPASAPERVRDRAYAGIDSPSFRSGVSIVPTLRDPAAQLHDYVFFEHTFSRTQPGKDPDRPYTGGGLNAIPSYVAVRSRTALLVRNDLDRRWGHADHAYEFYDYSVQSSERINQFDDRAYASEVATLMAKLQEFDACHQLQGGDPVTPECAALTREAPLG